MNVIHTAKELHPGTRKVCLAIGVFDGVHLGHQQVIRQAISDARQQEGIAVAITFDRHPNAVVAPDRTPPLIYPLAKKMRVLECLGTDTTLLLHFDQALSQLTADDFILGLARDLQNIHSICVGSTFTFGYKRQGNVDLLKRLGKELGFVVHGLAAVSLDGQRVSSTRIREALSTGQLDAASQMLGRPYSLVGNVVEGDKLGRQLGFPTANLDTAGLLLPPVGVYAIHAEVEKKIHRAVLNIGHRPTLQDPLPQLRVEAHLLDFSGDLYGKEIEITFIEKLREEQKFRSIEALKSQIEQDIVQARTLF
ncbi:MAG: bifunctional riboflavin kinase/FAD synthetase [Verrucomicrobia bacterium]|nr:bifunctional riboflavin kinase/FAD synthetase [Verrucomicrobiota bacterium]